MEKKAMMDYVMNSSFWPSLCHEDKVLPPQLRDLKTKSSCLDVVFDIFERIPLIEVKDTSVACSVQREWCDVSEGM
jgi:hypothetical protein